MSDKETEQVATSNALQITNEEFLRAIFGDEFGRVHVTGFVEDPTDLPSEARARAWGGAAFANSNLVPGTNQYFAISLFNPGEGGRAQRRKALFRSTHCFVLDDVREKLPVEEANKLPRPSWILVTSAGSEQWGYILKEPCTEAAQIDNLNDGLIASDLVPSGKDPGQRGVTRYVRLPEGVNTKRAKMQSGKPFDCRLVSFEPWNTVSLQTLAEPFDIDLTATRFDSHPRELCHHEGHPIFSVSNLNIKRAISPGRYDVTCPWVDEHTGNADDGAAIFLLEDGGLRFKCHHGACQERDTASFLDWVNRGDPEFASTLKRFQVDLAFADVPIPVEKPSKGFLDGAFKEFMVSEEVIQSMSNPDWLYENLLLRGHLVAIPAPPNAGKTTILFHIAEQLARKGLRVIYVNADISGGDAKQFWHRAEETGIELLLPDLANKPMSDLLEVLRKLSRGEESLGEVVLFIDTLKKITDVINKRESKEVYRILRALTSKNATVVLLSHTNKHPGADGKRVYEGTGDLRADVDELIYLEPVKNPDGSILVSTIPDKVRGSFDSITFRITKEREVTQEGVYVDTHQLSKDALQLEKDQDLIDAIEGILGSGSKNQSQILEHCKNTTGYGAPTARKVLQRYSESGGVGRMRWNTKRGDQNAIFYSLLGQPEIPSFI